MHVDVHQPRGNDVAARVEDIGRVRGRQAAGDGGDAALLDGDVERPVQPLRWIENASALDQQVVSCRRPAHLTQERR